jgi:tetratricopeptide (TPR) repeat protein
VSRGKGAPAEALIHYKKALNRPNIKDQEATHLYFQLGRVFQTMGERSEALYFFEKVARRDQGFQDVGQRVAACARWGSRRSSAGPRRHRRAANDPGCRPAAPAAIRGRR